MRAPFKKVRELQQCQHAAMSNLAHNPRCLLPKPSGQHDMFVCDFCPEHSFDANVSTAEHEVRGLVKVTGESGVIIKNKHTEHKGNYCPNIPFPLKTHITSTLDDCQHNMKPNISKSPLYNEKKRGQW